METLLNAALSVLPGVLFLTLLTIMTNENQSTRHIFGFCLIFLALLTGARLYSQNLPVPPQCAIELGLVHSGRDGETLHFVFSYKNMCTEPFSIINGENNHLISYLGGSTPGERPPTEFRARTSGLYRGTFRCKHNEDALVWILSGDASWTRSAIAGCAHPKSSSNEQDLLLI